MKYLVGFIGNIPKLLGLFPAPHRGTLEQRWQLMEQRRHDARLRGYSTPMIVYETQLKSFGL